MIAVTNASGELPNIKYDDDLFIDLFIDLFDDDLCLFKW